MITLTSAYAGQINIRHFATELGQVRLSKGSDDSYVENLRKLFIATGEDVRVIMIKLADRLHNMRTIEFLPNIDKQKKISLETLEIYAPIAGRLGIGAWKDELEDLAFQIVHPKEYKQTKTLLDQELLRRDENIKAKPSLRSRIMSR